MRGTEKEQRFVYQKPYVQVRVLHFSSAVFLTINQGWNQLLQGNFRIWGVISCIYSKSYIITPHYRWGDRGMEKRNNSSGTSMQGRVGVQQESTLPESAHLTSPSVSRHWGRLGVEGTRTNGHFISHIRVLKQGTICPCGRKAERPRCPNITGYYEATQVSTVSHQWVCLSKNP